MVDGFNCLICYNNYDLLFIDDMCSPFLVIIKQGFFCNDFVTKMLTNDYVCLFAHTVVEKFYSDGTAGTVPGTLPEGTVFFATYGTWYRY